MIPASKWQRTTILVLGGALALSLVLFGFLGGNNKAQAAPPQSQSVLEVSPYSGGVLVARAIQAGRLKPQFKFVQPGPGESLTCTPAPCTTPNVQASEGGAPVNETPMAATGTSKLLTGGNDYNCTSIQGFFISKDGGSTWNHTCKKTRSGQSGFGDPIVGWNTSGTAFVGGIEGTGGTPTSVAFEKSTNNGMTYSSPALAVKPVSPFVVVDKPWMQIDTTTSSHKNNIYISTTQFTSGSTPNSGIVVTRSTNSGTTWTSVKVNTATWPKVNQFSDLAIGKDGTVYLTWMQCPATGVTGDCGGTVATMMFSKSTNGGMTFSAATAIASVNLAPDTCGAFYGCLPNTSERVSNIPSIDVDRSTGSNSNALYVVMYNYTGTQMQVQVVKSSNGGTSWGAPVRVAVNGANDEFFPWLTVNSTNGTVGVTWLDRRNDSANIKYDSFGAVSTDGGATFPNNLRLSTMISNPSNDGFGGAFMGDYTGNYWCGNIVFASWTDTRTGTAQDEVAGYRAK